ncbi:A24 family peptidase [Marinomonas arctica]
MTITEWFLYILFTSSLGSYAAAFAARWPVKNEYLWRKEAHLLLSLPFSTNEPETVRQRRSQCMSCHHLLAWQDLIPILSYVFLKGRCRYCKKNISYRYPIIECLHIMCCLPLPWLTDGAFQLVLHTIVMSTLLTAASIDMKHKLLPDECNLLVVACALLLHLSLDTLENSVLGLLVGFSLICGLRQCCLVIRRYEGIGLGDAKLVAALGAWLGLSNLSALLLCASLSGILYTILINQNGSKQIAFGPFLIFSAILVFYL